MAETHAIYALKKRRQEITTEMRKLGVALAHIDATIRLMEPECKPLPGIQGALTRKILDALREAGHPLSSKEIAEAVDEDLRPVRGAIDSQRKQGLIRGIQKSGTAMKWELVSPGAGGSPTLDSANSEA